MSIYIYPNKRRGFQVQPTKPSLCADTTIPWDLGTSSEGSLVACWGRESGPKKQKEEVEKVNLYGNFTLGTGSFSEWSHECSQPLLHLLTALFWALLQNSTFTPIVNIKSLREVVSFFFEMLAILTSVSLVLLCPKFSSMCTFIFLYNVS